MVSWAFGKYLMGITRLATPKCTPPEGAFVGTEAFESNYNRSFEWSRLIADFPLFSINTSSLQNFKFFLHFLMPSLPLLIFSTISFFEGFLTSPCLFPHKKGTPFLLLLVFSFLPFMYVSSHSPFWQKLPPCQSSEGDDEGFTTTISSSVNHGDPVVFRRRSAILFFWKNPR
ncbi:hypothetical protein ABFS83_14G191700 [Erythranthe nasuta]